MSLAESLAEKSPEFSYHLLRHALNTYRKQPSQLDPHEYDRVYQQAGKGYALESLVLASPEAEGLVLAEAQLDAAIQAVAARYGSREEFHDDLQSNGLHEEGLRKALRRELLFDAVMQRVAADSAEVNELDLRLYYEMHHERFQTPQARTASHLLITVNPDYAENTRQAAGERMRQISEKLAGRGNRFAIFAKRYSECPTAMQGGELGDVTRGQLYESLDAVLFKLAEGQVSEVVESELGFHILYCQRIKPAHRVPFGKAAPRIRELLHRRQRRNCQKAWLAGLRKNTQA